MTFYHFSGSLFYRKLCAMLTSDFTFSKRQLGLILLVAGLLAAGGIFAIDIIDFGREGGIGPAQRAAIALMLLLAFVGMTLLPLGDDPA